MCRRCWPPVVPFRSSARLPRKPPDGQISKPGGVNLLFLSAPLTGRRKQVIEQPCGQSPAGAGLSLLHERSSVQISRRNRFPKVSLLEFWNGLRSRGECFHFIPLPGFLTPIPTVQHRPWQGVDVWKQAVRFSREALLGFFQTTTDRQLIDLGVFGLGLARNLGYLRPQVSRDYELKERINYQKR